MQNAECRIENEGLNSGSILNSQFCILHSAFMRLIPKTGPIRATVTAPPSKSYSVRALLLAAMSVGTTTISNCLDADDTRYAFEALRAIGFDVSGSFQRELFIGNRKSMSANEVEVFV